MFDIRIDDLSGEPIRDLLRCHAEGMLEASPPGACHFFDIDRLKDPSVTVWSVWDGNELAGCGALHEIEATHGELKSMRTHDLHLGKGVGRAVLAHIVAEARRRGYRRLSLETGRGEPFAAAIHLYDSFGFSDCGPFGDYTESDFSLYLTLEL
ncbi:MAG: GNAT family N-acetyltransferase [Acidimicrobiales bacterium]|nr:GNAT family N-acetyltransferase [Acidimicrobiales bacterium]